MRHIVLLSIVLMALIAVSSVACARLPSPRPTSDASPSVDVEATVTARLRQERDRVAVPTPDVEATVTARLKEERARAAAPTSEAEAPSEARVAAKLIPSVVRITARRGVGSGLVVGDGLILTNRHVVEESTSATVETGAGEQLRARVVARNSLLDLALLQFSDNPLPVAAFADVSRMKPGEPVLAIGYPLDLKGDATVTRGLFSAIRVGEPAPGEWVQTDAAVNAGNSGGPLANLRGEVVGLITLKRVQEGSVPVEGINFALSASSIQQVLPAMSLAVGVMPPGARETSTDLVQEVADFLRRYDEAEIEAYSTSDPTPLKDLSSPALYSYAEREIKAQKALGVRRVSKLLDFRLDAAYTLPGDLVMADVFERWRTGLYRGQRLLEDIGETDQPQIPVIKRTPNGWQLVGIHWRER